jgi:hypothetical protein
VSNLMTASSQWASRPDDQRFLSLDDLQTAVSARRSLSHDRNLPLHMLKLDHDAAGELYLAGHNGQRVAFTNWSFGQFASLLKRPPRICASAGAARACEP